MVVFDGRLRGKSLLCVLLLKFIPIFAYEGQYYRNHYNLKCSPENDEKLLKINKQIIVDLTEVDTATYYFENVQTYDHTLSVTITPCSSRIKWSFLYIPYNSIENSNDSLATLDGGLEEVIGEGEDNTTRTSIANKAKKGCYFLILISVEGPTKVSIYLTMDNGGPFELTIRQNSNLSLIPQRKQRLKISWDHSLINPHNTSYCLVVSRKKEFLALCAAEEEGIVFGYVGDDSWLNMNNLEKGMIKKRGNATEVQNQENKTVVICVGKKLHLTLTKMKKNVVYHVSLFTTNSKTNFTTLYGRSQIKYNFKAKPFILKDGKRKTVDLKKYSGEAYFKFKAIRKVREINFYVLVCGGAVQVEFTRRDRKEKETGLEKANITKVTNKGNYMKNSHKVNSTRVFGYQKFVFNNSGEYAIKVSVPDMDEKNRVEYVEVFATKHPNRYPLPAMPKELRVYEFRSRRTCNSVTIGWIPEPDNTVNTYCITVRENNFIDLADKFRASFQCHLDSPNIKGFSSSKYGKKYYVYRKCREHQAKQKISITNHTITNLRPGKSYTIQVTVEKKKGRTLSYQLLKVVTKYSCDQRFD